jgi:hypothetical protein
VRTATIPLQALARLITIIAAVALLHTPPVAVSMQAALSANLWVAPAGSAYCERSAAPTPYPAALKRNAVCDTADHAYHAAAIGDIVRVKDGAYGGFAFTADPTKTSGTVVIEPETDYGVTLTSHSTFGSGVSYLTVKHFTITAPDGGFINSPHGLSRDITIDGNHINVGQKVNGRPAGILFYSNIDGYRIVNNVIGPTCCGSTNQSSPVAITIGKPNNQAPNANDVLIDGNTIQYVLRNAAYWPTASYGPAPDVSCLVATCHQDAIQIWGIQNSTISDNLIDHAEVQGIFIEDAAGAVNQNINIINNQIQVVGGDAGMNLKGVSGSWNVAFNSTPNIIVTGFGFKAAAPGTRIAFEANEGNLLVANAGGNNGGCVGGNPNVSLAYSYNTWHDPHGGGTPTSSCSTTDRVSAPVGYAGLGGKVNAFNARHLHGDQGLPSAGPAYYEIDRIRKHRVLAFHLNLEVSPGLPVKSRFDLLTRDALPDDIVVRIHRSRCIVWRSRKLDRLTKGLEYAAATISGGATTSLRAEAKPRC